MIGDGTCQEVCRFGEDCYYIWVIVGAQMIVPNGYRVMKRAIQNATMLNATGIMEIVTVIWTVLVDMSE